MRRTVVREEVDFRATSGKNRGAAQCQGRPGISAYPSTREYLVHHRVGLALLARTKKSTGSAEDLPRNFRTFPGTGPSCPV